MNHAGILKKAKDMGLHMVDFKFLDFIGTWQHFTVPLSYIDDTVFEDGLGFDGSSIRGWKEIHQSDTLVIPDPDTFKIEPFSKVPTLSFICDVHEPSTKTPYDRDPRALAKRALSYLKSTGLADTAFYGPEAEFFIFDDVRFSQNMNGAMFYVDSSEGPWNSDKAEKPNQGYRPRTKEGYIPVPPIDSQNDIRNEMVIELEKLGLQVERQHHEVASAGQAEIDLKYMPMLEMADSLMWFKYVVKNVAWRNGKTATFMPKPLFGENGSGMHVHVSLWKDSKPLFAGNEYAGLSKMALHFIGGILKHGRALTALTNPTTNSYKRLVPGYEAPVNLAYSLSNRSAAIRIPAYSPSPSAKRIEFRTADPTCNPYLAFSAILMAGLDGIENHIDPGKPLDKNIYGLSKAELREVPSTPESFGEALNELEKDCDFLMKGNVFTEDVIKTWIEYKKEKEVVPMSMRPVPYEFLLYYDI